jgi:predicted unusual protein kinase regulating ubiquinone biosynthesis (AarF/ABC1/UbiB family)
MLRARYRKILLFYARTILNLAFWDVVLPKIGLRGIAEKGRSKRLRRIAQRYRQIAIEMGGVMIKVGQFLSTRVDMLPAEVTDELSGLQDEVPAEDFQKILQLAESELGTSIQERFESFQEEPLASASLGQVHRAVLKPEDNLPEGDPGVIKEVVVKIQRPNIKLLIDTDLAALRRVTDWLKRYPPIHKRADLPALIDEFSRILSEEIDYLAEGQNAERFWDYYQEDPQIKVPRVIWSHTTKKVLTLEDVYAIKITNFQEITAAGVDRSAVAERLFACYMEQIFEHEFFHADPHPGNLFVIPQEVLTNPDQPTPETTPWQLAFVDFGMVGHVPETAREGLREGVIAIGTQDPRRLVSAYQKLGFLLPEADLEILEKAEAKAFERFWGKSMSELAEIDHQELVEFASEFRDLMYDMPFQIPQDLLLLGRTLAILSGMCTGLDPAFNIWKSIRPYAEDLIKSEVTGNIDLWLGELERLVRSLLSAPKRMEAAFDLIETGNLKVQVPELQGHLVGIERNLQRLTGAIIFAALILGGVQLTVAGQLLPGMILMGAALITLMVLILK